MKTFKLTLISILLLTSGVVLCQPNVNWSVFMNDSNWRGYVKKCLIDNENNIYIAGNTSYWSTGDDFIIIKYHQSGNELWRKTFNKAYVDEIRDAGLDNLGNIYITGCSFDTAYTGYIIKYNSIGTKQWEKSLSYNSSFTNYKLILDENGNVYCTFSVWRNSSPDICLIKYNNWGTVQWIKYYNDPYNLNDEPKCIISDNNGNVYIGVTINDINSSRYYFTLIKYNSTGSLLWESSCQISSYGSLTGICIDQNDRITITGNTSGNFASMVYILQFDNSGTLKWVNAFQGYTNFWDEPNIVTDNNSNIYVTARSQSGIPDSNSCYLIKYNSNGNMLWKWELKDTSLVNLSRVIYFNNHIYTAGNYNNKFIINKNDINGNLIWSKNFRTWNDNLSFWFVDFALDKNGCPVFTGHSGGHIKNDFVTLKLSSVIGITTINNNIPEEYKLYQNYPNPFNPITKIKFSIPNQSNVILTVYNSLGQTIEILVNEQLKSGEYEIDFDGSKYSSGVYFYLLSTNNYKETRKMVLIK